MSSLCECRRWHAYLRDVAVRNTFLGRPVLTGVDWRMKP